MSDSGFSTRAARTGSLPNRIELLRRMLAKIRSVAPALSTLLERPEKRRDCDMPHFNHDAKMARNYLQAGINPDEHA